MRKPATAPRGRTPGVPRAKLAAVIDRVAEEYAHFVSDPPLEDVPPDSKNFAARQAAARVALAHISELAALAAEEPETAEETAEDILAKARATLAREGDADPPPPAGEGEEEA
ncbi:hypothetical protein [Falsiroseomonas ponticola]|jgi:hypothetical protein|uniref:hypothetical protein n=1 Tax=Falsiroseomonas ponticola TaxID=2786951 RepID=UPI0019316B03|nr:hypothetical protein [Roseomonas ponticola]